MLYIGLVPVCLIFLLYILFGGMDNMNYLLHRVKESNGFVAGRVLTKAFSCVAMAYGTVFLDPYSGRIMTPDKIYKRKS